MIIDNINNAEKYFGLGEKIKRALLFIKENNFESMSDGKYEIKDSEIFAMVNRYETKLYENGTWEAHKKYIDVQFVAEGTEKMGYADITKLTVTKEYENDKDIMFLKGKGDFITAERGTFAIFFPSDAHMPGMNPEKISQNIVKVVVKVIAD